MFRRRIYAQFFTIAVIVAGSAYWSQDRNRRAEFDKVEKERLAVERRERWLAELEARDREDRELREVARASRERRLAGGGAAPEKKAVPAAGSEGEGGVLREVKKSSGSWGFWSGKD